jgi:hypothetical protein
MLPQLLKDDRAEIIARARSRIDARSIVRPGRLDSGGRVALLLEQLIEGLAQSAPVAQAGHAAAHAALFQLGLSLEQVVRDYADLRHAIVERLAESRARVGQEHLDVLHRAVDAAIVTAVSEHARLQVRQAQAQDAERLRLFVHDLRNELNSVVLAHSTLKADDDVGSALLERSLTSLRQFVESSWAEMQSEPHSLSPSA